MLEVRQREATMLDMNGHILMIEDDQRLSDMVSDYLSSHGLQVSSVTTLAQGRQWLAKHTCDVLLLDLMLPDGDGLDMCRALRADSSTQHLPMLMLSARGEPTDRVVGLEIGADDYLPKPFEPRELLARVRALLRRSHAVQPTDASEVIRFGRLEIDADLRQVRLNGAPCDLTAYQFDLLHVMAKNPGRVLSRDFIMDALKGHALEAFDRSIDVHVSRIRAVIEDDPKNPQRILTVRGAGYIFARKQDSE
jgi:DNA-binding response OmpR family regulator